jgi:nucleoside-diphosphate-sugar epimerase
MRVLFIGGTGTISSACVAAAVARGIDLTVLNRGSAGARDLPDGVQVLHGDIRHPAAAAALIGRTTYDAVVDFVAFTPDQVAADIAFWEGRTGQFIFISSASAYRTPLTSWPITESTALANPYWDYSRDKIAGEELLTAAFRERGFPMTIVRPAHTYDRRQPPTLGGWTDVDRLLQGKPVVVHGDGTSLWTITHHTDFAEVFVGLLGHPAAIGEAFHITGDQVMTWDGIYATLARAFGVEANLVHIASEAIAREVPQWGAGLVGDKAHCLVFDNSKVRALAPLLKHPVTFAEGAAEMAAWYRANPDRITVRPEWDTAFDHLIERYGPR